MFYNLIKKFMTFIQNQAPPLILLQAKQWGGKQPPKTDLFFEKKHNTHSIGRLSPKIKYFETMYSPKWNYRLCPKRQVFVKNSLNGVLLVNFPEKEKNFLIKNLAAENKIPLITQSASLLLKDSRNMDDLLGVDDPIQVLFDKVKASVPCICVRAVQNMQ